VLDSAIVDEKLLLEILENCPFFKISNNVYCYFEHTTETKRNLIAR
jgi:hypothetical protein